MSKLISERIKKVESEGKKAILIDCERCNRKVVVPVSKTSIIESKTKYLPIAYIHKNSRKDNPHCLLFELDRDFKVQLSKAVDCFFSTQKEDKDFQKLVKRDVYIYCERCGETITIPIPEYMVKDSLIPKTPISFVHNNKFGLDQHCLVAYLDSNFGDRDTRLINMIIIDLFSY